MLRAPIHLGLAIILVIAPALCCCNVRFLAVLLTPSEDPGAACSTCREPEPRAATCCNRATSSQNSGSTSKAGQAQQTQSLPGCPQPEHCNICFATTDAIAPESQPRIGEPEPTGELVSVALLGLAALPPEHLGLQGGLDPPEGAGVDPRSEALYLRHVLRC